AEIHQGEILLSDSHPDAEMPGLTVAVKMPAFTGVRKRIKAAQVEQIPDGADEARSSADSQA
ncbi:MAG: two-component sensor histidine kinase, partial [Marinobacter sp.]